MWYVDGVTKKSFRTNDNMLLIKEGDTNKCKTKRNVMLHICAGRITCGDKNTQTYGCVYGEKRQQ